MNKQYYEPVPYEVAKLEMEDKYMKIKNLSKTYPNGDRAVKGINLRVY
jgi:hypothetical protein